MNVLVKDGNRLNSGYCLRCGAILMHPYDDLTENQTQCCESCNEQLARDLYQFDKKRRKTKKMNNKIVITKPHIVHPLITDYEE